MSYTPQQQQQQQQPPAEMSPEDVEEFSKMFPGLDKQVIKVHLSMTNYFCFIVKYIFFLIEGLYKEI